MKKVSVIITTYNGAKKNIKHTIESIQNQEGNGEKFVLEIIVVDDCSTDNTVEIVKEYDVILLSNNKNSGGPNKGRNLGLTKATGDYICIADQDDIWESRKIQTLLPYLKDAPIVSSGYTLIDNSTGKNIVRVNKSDKQFLFYEKNNTFLNKLIRSYKGQYTYLGSLIYSSDLKNIHFEETFGMVDSDWLLRLFENQCSIEVCDSLYKRYVDNTNLSLDESYRRKDFYYTLMFMENYLYKYPKKVRIAYKKIHGSRARYYYLKNDMNNARFYFLKSGLSLKTIAYYLSTYIGSSYVKKKFNVFG